MVPWMGNMLRGMNSLSLGMLALVLLAFVTTTEARAGAGDPLPTAPLADVTVGQTCEARTVLHGTEISSFDVKIKDIVGPGAMGYGTLIYFEVTDPAVAEVGVAQGMSGSPILCEIGGVNRVVGAISYGFDAVGPVGFATPIEDVLNGQPRPAGFAAYRAARLYKGRRVVPLTPPLTVTGVPQAARKTFRKYLETRGYDSVAFAAPTATDVPPGSPDLAPGGAFSMNYAYGDVTIGAICTISYRDGDDFWGCGHPVDLAGPRSISFSGAYIYDVLGSPWSLMTPFKFGTATRTQVGSVLYDGPYAISGKLGRSAPSTPVKVTVRNDDGKTTLESHAANEYGLPGGDVSIAGSLGLTLPLSAMLATQAQFEHGGQPSTQNGRVCMKQTIVGAGRRVETCNRFATSMPAWLFQFLDVPTGAATPTEFLVGGLGSLLASAKYKELRPGPLEVSVNIATGSALRQIVGFRPLGKVRLGSKARFRVVSADVRGKRYAQNISLRVPRKSAKNTRPLRPGRKEAFRVVSGAFYSGMGDGTYLATDNDAEAYFRYASGDDWFGPGGSIRSPKELDEAISALFRAKAKLYVRVPWTKRPLAFPLRGGGSIVVGDGAAKVKLRRAAGR